MVLQMQRPAPEGFLGGGSINRRKKKQNRSPFVNAPQKQSENEKKLQIFFNDQLPVFSRWEKCQFLVKK
jgi:hypothetical protein